MLPSASSCTSVHMEEAETASQAWVGSRACACPCWGWDWVVWWVVEAVALLVVLLMEGLGLEGWLDVETLAAAVVPWVATEVVTLMEDEEGANMMILTITTIMIKIISKMETFIAPSSAVLKHVLPSQVCLIWAVSTNVHAPGLFYWNVIQSVGLWILSTIRRIVTHFEKYGASAQEFLS